MKKKMLWIIGGIIVGTNVISAPNYRCTSGLIEIISAESEPMGRFNWMVLGFRGVWVDKKDSIPPLWYKTERGIYDTSSAGEMGRCVIIEVPFSFGFAFTNYLSANLYLPFLIDIMRTSGIEKLGAGGCTYGFGDTYLGIKFIPTNIVPLFSDDFARVVDFGVCSGISFATGRVREKLPDTCGVDTVFGVPCRKGEGGIHRFYTNKGTSMSVKGLLTLSSPTTPKFRLHINVGYEYLPPHPEICSKISYGVGVECEYSHFSPFVEYYSESRIGKYNDGASYFTPGLRFETAQNVWLTLGMGFRMYGGGEEFSEEIQNKYLIQGGFGAAPPWRIEFTLSHGYDFGPKEIPKSVVRGRVIDEEGIPLKAIVNLGDTSVTTDKEGRYRIEIDGGKVTMYAVPIERDKYQLSKEITKYVPQGEEVVVNFRLKAKPKKVEKKPTILTGKVVDKNKGTPITHVTVSFPESNISPIATDEVGIYKVEVPAGTHMVKFEKEGYISQTHPVICKEGKTSILDVKLTPVKRMGIIVGKVKDYSSHQIIQGAKITFPGTSIEGVVTSSAGIYKKEVPPGTYEIKVEKEGYVPDGGVVVVEAGETVTKDFELFKKEEKIILRGINFEFNSAVIKPSSYPVLDEAVELLKKHPKVIVEIGGHTDAVGSDAYNLKLSKLRAESVKKYLVRKGIDPSRLRTRGYGETMPIADNSTPAGRELNRRIEFKILSK